MEERASGALRKSHKNHFSLNQCLSAIEFFAVNKKLSEMALLALGDFTTANKVTFSGARPDDH